MKRLTFPQDSIDSRSGAEQATHYFARLMTPVEVADATRREPPEVQQKTEGHWVLSGDVSASMFQLLKNVPAKQFPVRLTGFSSPAGFSYFVLTHQVQHCQHRFLLGLTDPAVQSFLKAISSTGQLTFMLGDDDGYDSLLLPNPLLPAMFMPVLARAPEVNLETQRAALAELPCVQAVMGAPHQVPSLLEGYRVQHVCVSLLLPEVLNEVFKTAISNAAGV